MEASWRHLVLGFGTLFLKELVCEIPFEFWQNDTLHRSFLGYNRVYYLPSTYDPIKLYKFF